MSAESRLAIVRSVAEHYLPSFLAGERADASLYAPGVTSWRNIGEVETPLDLPPSLSRARRSEPMLRVEEVRWFAHEGGFVIQAVTVGPGVRVPSCLLVTVDEQGQISRFEQYADSAAAAPLLGAIDAADASP